MGMYRDARGSLKLGIQKGLPGGGDVSAGRLGACKDPEESECFVSLSHSPSLRASPSMGRLPPVALSFALSPGDMLTPGF